MKILPVIHHLDGPTTLAQAELAIAAGADGVFLIAHGFPASDPDAPLAELGREIKSKHPDKLVGLNFLSRGALAAASAAAEAGLDMAWGDDCGVDSRGLSALGEKMRDFAAAHPEVRIFASVAFKYREFEPFPGRAAAEALAAGFLPTTSGSATGVAAPVGKAEAMSRAAGGLLAMASGLTAENVGSFAGSVSHALVATGVSRDDHHFDEAKLREFIAAARD